MFYCNKPIILKLGLLFQDKRWFQKLAVLIEKKENVPSCNTGCYDVYVNVLHFVVTKVVY